MEISSLYNDNINSYVLYALGMDSPPFFKLRQYVRKPSFHIDYGFKKSSF